MKLKLCADVLNCVRTPSCHGPLVKWQHYYVGDSFFSKVGNYHQVQSISWFCKDFLSKHANLEHKDEFSIEYNRTTGLFIIIGTTFRGSPGLESDI